MAQFSSTANPTENVVAPPRAAKAPYLRDAAGNIYLWTPELAARGDLVAAYDPDEPERFADDQKQIELNRRLEIAQQNAQAEEAARIKAEKEKLEAETQAREAEELANANARNLEIARKQLEEKETEHAKKVAELQAQIDALAKGQAKEVLAEENGEDKAVEEAETKRKSPPKKDKKASQESATVDLEDLDQ
jgi:hypothetical protein|uniref:Uncharacterized protein n=1 Tax=Podoviridae sp. ctUS21 TaxID=2826557 RepID=A0A8S5MR02_9CAUD|nr:MAG TPA: hypothetical protein [Podoviridae sp. ctUS21]